MSVGLYDKALLDKIKGWVKDDSMRITSPNETRRLFEYKADIENDAPIKLPLITLRRASQIEILNTNKKPLTYDGLTIKYKEENDTPTRGLILNAIPIDLNYQIDIYTRYFNEGDEYVRNFVFNLINYPTLIVELPYNNCKSIKEAHIRLLSTIEDNSDIPERILAGEFTRFTLQIHVDDAYLYDCRAKDHVCIDEIQFQYD